jgi:aspartyl-tRNA synthetase
VDEESKRYFARHPRSSPKLADVDKLERSRRRWRARTTSCSTVSELGGRSIESTVPKSSRAVPALGINEDEARERFGFLLEAFRYAHRRTAASPRARPHRHADGVRSLRDVVRSPNGARRI